MTPAVACTGLVKSFGETVAVDDVTFQIADGEAYGLLGPNGAGKTTTISMLVGLQTPDAGTVSIFGTDIAADPVAAKRLVGYVPQEIALFPELTARENLRYFGRLYGLGRRELIDRGNEVLELVGLADRADERIEKYSGGMKRRINIAVALLHRPRLLVLDEPTVGVDPQSRSAILDQVEHLVHSGMSLLYTSHYMEEVERVCTRIGITDHGKIIAEGTKRELVSLSGSHDRIEIVLDGEGKVGTAMEKLRGVDGVSQVVETGPSAVRLIAQDGRRLLPTVIEAVAGTCAVTSVEVVEPDLEGAFLQLTGTRLRD